MIVFMMIIWGEHLMCKCDTEMYANDMCSSCYWELLIKQYYDNYDIEFNGGI